MLLVPKEHGAYGQLAFPLVTALAVSGVSAPAALLAAATVACFLAHEPLLVVLGARGPRARREQARRAAVWLAALGVSATAAAALALAWLPVSVRWSLLVPVAPAIAVAIAIVAGREKTWPAEVGVSLAFSGAAFPVAVAGGAASPTAATPAIVFAVNFVLATLAVRIVILKVRGGGNPPAVASMRRAVLFLACGVAVAIVVACSQRLLPWAALAGGAPGLITAAALAICPPPPTRLRMVGWMLVTTSAFTASVLIIMLRLLHAAP